MNAGQRQKLKSSFYLLHATFTTFTAQCTQNSTTQSGSRDLHISFRLHNNWFQNTCVLLAVWLTWKSNLDCKRVVGGSDDALLNLLWNYYWQKRGKLPSWLIESFVVPLHLKISSELAIIRCINYVLIDIARKAIAIIMIGALHRSQTYCLPVIGLVCTLRYIFLHFYCYS